MPGPSLMAESLSSRRRRQTFPASACTEHELRDGFRTGCVQSEPVCANGCADDAPTRSSTARMHAPSTKLIVTLYFLNEYLDVDSSLGWKPIVKHHCLEGRPQ